MKRTLLLKARESERQPELTLGYRQKLRGLCTALSGCTSKATFAVTRQHTREQGAIRV